MLFREETNDTGSTVALNIRSFRICAAALTRKKKRVVGLVKECRLPNLSTEDDSILFLALMNVTTAPTRVLILGGFDVLHINREVETLIPATRGE